MALNDRVVAQLAEAVYAPALRAAVYHCTRETHAGTNRGNAAREASDRDRHMALDNRVVAELAVAVGAQHRALPLTTAHV